MRDLHGGHGVHGVRQNVTTSSTRRLYPDAELHVRGFIPVDPVIPVEIFLFCIPPESPPHALPVFWRPIACPLFHPCGPRDPRGNLLC